MTIVKISRSGGRIVKVTANGHTGYAETEDIVCSALSSIMQTAVLGLLRVANIPVRYKILDDKGSLEMELPELSDTERRDADMILETMFLGIADLYEGYSEYVKLEVN